MSDFRLPNLADMKRMPAGDRVPRLRALRERHRNALAKIDPLAKDRASQYRRTTHSGALVKLKKLAIALGEEWT